MGYFGKSKKCHNPPSPLIFESVHISIIPIYISMSMYLLPIYQSICMSFHKARITHQKTTSNNTKAFVHIMVNFFSCGLTWFALKFKFEILAETPQTKCKE